MAREYPILRWGSKTINASAIKTLNVYQSCDLSGCSAPYATLVATVYGTGYDSLMGGRNIIALSTNRRAFRGYFVRNVRKVGENAVEITAISSLGVLAEEYHEGLAFFNNIIFGTLTDADIDNILSRIVGSEFSIDTSHLEGAYRISDGLLPEGNKRDMLAMIAQAHGCWISPYLELKYPWPAGDAITIPTSRVYRNPKLTARETYSKLTINSYYRYTGTSDDYENVYAQGYTFKIGKYEPRVFTRNTTGAKQIEICNYALPFIQPSISSLVTIKAYDINILQYYSCNKIWEGRVLWNTTTAECELGSKVKVPCNDGTTVTGFVIQSNLNFSGASVVADMKVLVSDNW